MTDPAPIAAVRRYHELSDELTEQASKEQLAETARILAMWVAFLIRERGDVPAEEMTDYLRGAGFTRHQADLVMGGLEHYVVLLARIMRDKPAIPPAQ